MDLFDLAGASSYFLVSFCVYTNNIQLVQLYISSERYLAAKYTATIVDQPTGWSQDQQLISPDPNLQEDAQLFTVSRE